MYEYKSLYLIEIYKVLLKISSYRMKEKMKY